MVPQSTLRVERTGRVGSPPQDYGYAILRGSEHIGDYFHDFRNDERWFVIDGIRHTVRGTIQPIDWERGQPPAFTPEGERLFEELINSERHKELVAHAEDEAHALRLVEAYLAGQSDESSPYVLTACRNHQGEWAVAAQPTTTDGAAVGEPLAFQVDLAAEAVTRWR
jgi:hypothetical protein